MTAMSGLKTFEPAVAAPEFGTVPDPIGLMRHFAPRVEGHILEGCGHWTQQERPAEVTALLLDWLKQQ